VSRSLYEYDVPITGRKLIHMTWSTSSITRQSFLNGIRDLINMCRIPLMTINVIPKYQRDFRLNALYDNIMLMSYDQRIETTRRLIASITYDSTLTIDEEEKYNEPI
jgi:hypothetical protein